MQRFLRILAGGTLTLALTAPVWAADLAAQFDDTGTFWTLTPDTFIAQTEAGAFKWNTPGPDGEAHYPGYTNSPKLSWGEFRIYDANVTFAKGLAKEARLSLFNRGDAGSLRQKDFEALVKQIDDATQQRLGVKPLPMPRQSVTRGSTIMAKRWIKPPYRMTLQWSMMKNENGFRAEFIQLEIESAVTAGGKNTPAVALKTGSNSKTDDLKKSLQKTEDGTVWIANMPMVDQGMKGYCAVATAERVLRYYGSEVSEHLLAGIANSSATAGTDPNQMLGALKQSGGKLGLGVRILADFNVQGFRRMVDLYNRAAKREKKNTLTLGNPIDVGEIYAQMDPEILLDVRSKGMKADFQKFQRDITQKINAGIPLLWGVQLGVYAEADLPQKGGGHLRLIIGYNQKKGELVYSDSWGAEHAKKTMPMAQAWAMTTMLSILEARKGL